jgi:hypothetical protein
MRTSKLTPLLLASALTLTSIGFYATASTFSGFNMSPRAASVEYMTGTGDMHGLRLAYRPNTFHTVDWPLIGQATIEWEGSLNLYDIHGSARNEATFGASISPILIKSIPSFSKDYPLAIEFGIGLAYVHEQKFGGVDIGSDYQFEDRLGLVMQLGPNNQSEVALRYIHYSNGGFNTKNPGLDFASLAYIHRF